MKRILILIIVISAVIFYGYLINVDNAIIQTKSSNFTEVEVVSKNEFFKGSLDKNFNMIGKYCEEEQTYLNNHLQYAITVTDVEGNAVDSTVSVKLHDYNHGYALSNANVKADGTTTVVPNVSIIPNNVYYFTYEQTSGIPQELTVCMKINNYNKIKLYKKQV